mmetsp:Transcript_37656/g.88076  ORF Transcript_37656/g.88076 Transcript_37656/m.88076 type:complete len:97 (+) Transcript_37656:692-982(+)
MASALPTAKITLFSPQRWRHSGWLWTVMMGSPMIQMAGCSTNDMEPQTALYMKCTLVLLLLLILLPAPLLGVQQNPQLCYIIEAKVKREAFHLKLT